ncbi:MAG: hypothetical protein ACWA6Y_10210 [Polaromonas sp.]
MNRIATAALMAAVFVSLSACGKSDAELRAEAEAAQRAELRKPVLAQLKDPDSATFRNETLRPPGTLCGEYNSKNSMGGYAGYARFIVSKANFVDFEDGSLLPLDKNQKWELTANLEEISKRYDVLITKQRSSLGLPEKDKISEATNFEKRWAEYCV